MKAIVLDPTGSVRLFADSSLLRTGDPLFVPDHLGEWQAEICPAIRISRLGTNIPLKMADRHFDACMLVGVVSERHPGTLPEGAAGLLDRSFAPGMPVATDFPENPELTVSTAPGLTFSAVLTDLHTRFIRAVHELSRYCTFKNGDLIALSGSGLPPIPLKADDTITATLSGGANLTLRLK